jgi:hypothetical protein
VSSRRSLVPVAALVGAILIVIAIVYFVEPAHALPSFFPGHVSTANHDAGSHHAKHGVAALVLAMAAFAFAWFASGPAPTAPASPTTP